MPDYLNDIAEPDRKKRADFNDDLCIVDDEFFFIRGLVEIPVVDVKESFSWSVWVSLSKESFRRTEKLWKKKGRESEAPYFGWLNNNLPTYPSTINLKTHVHTRPVGRRPFVEIEPTDHPLAVEQRQGISMSRVQKIAEMMQHSNPAP